MTLDKPVKKEEVDESGPDSIIQICKDEGLKTLFLVEDNMVGFLEAKKNCGKDIQLCFGLRLTFCSDMTDKSDESAKTESKLIIFARNASGYFRLTKIYTKANVEGYRSGPRLDLKTLKEFWSDEDLILVVPFYDSFIFENSFYLKNCVPDFSGFQPTFFLEDNGLYIDDILQESVQKFDPSGIYPRQRVKTIYYKNRKDFLAWQTYKCIMNESVLTKPNLENCASDEFCFESWKEAVKV